MRQSYRCPPQIETNRLGHLETRGIELSALAARFGTPLYVMDEALIRQHCRDYWRGLDDYANGQIVYAGKALLNQAICRIIEQERLYLDVVSGGELYTALSAGFPAEKMLFHGNNKTKAELQLALQSGIGRIVVDNLNELQLLQQLTKDLACEADLMLRITPGVEAHTHEYIRTAQTDSKFGLGISDLQLQDAIQAILQTPRLHLQGIHCHIGSQIMEEEPYSLAVELMFGLLEQIRSRYQLTLPELNLGGGIGIRYTSEDQPLQPTAVVQHIAKQVRLQAEKHNFPLPKLFVEPGRAIVGEAGISLYTIGGIKELPGIRRYVSVDGGMSDNIRPALYQAVYEAVVVDKANEPLLQQAHLAGKHCETGDILIKDLWLPAVAVGDVIAVFATGAYNYSMASNYNRVTRPAMVLISPAGADLMEERETYQDLIRLDRMPAHLK